MILIQYASDPYLELRLFGQQFIYEELGLRFLIDNSKFLFLLLELHPQMVVILKKQQSRSQCDHHFAPHKSEQSSKKVPRHLLYNYYREFIKSKSLATLLLSININEYIMVFNTLYHLDPHFNYNLIVIIDGHCSFYKYVLHWHIHRTHHEEAWGLSRIQLEARNSKSRIFLKNRKGDVETGLLESLQFQKLQSPFRVRQNMIAII